VIILRGSCLCREALEFRSLLQRLRPPPFKRSEKNCASADVILEFSQVSVEADVRNHEVICTDDVPGPLSGFDFLD